VLGVFWWMYEKKLLACWLERQPVRQKEPALKQSMLCLFYLSSKH